MTEPFALKTALLTAKVYGFRVMPVHGPLEFGGCTCGKSDCSSAGKHPSISEWQKKASNDESVIISLFLGATNDFNYGIATGPESGIFVLDIDGAIGEESLINLENQHGKLPDTLTAKTGSGGRHLFFKYPDKKVHGRASKLAPNVDVRGEGGQVVGPGSNHRSGRKYEWVNPLEEIVDAPDWLIDMVCRENVRTAPSLPIINQKPSLHIVNSDEWSEEDIKDMLSYIDPDSSYDDWYQIGMALHSYNVPFHIWDTWSQAGSKYVPGETITKWNSFRSSGVTIGTLVHYAKEAGWRKQPPMPYVPPVKSEIMRADITNENNEFDEKTGEIIENHARQEDINKEHKERSIKYIFSKDIKPSLETNDFVQGMFGRGQMSVVYGESNCGKTFFMTDLAFHVALGRQWREKRVDKGGVVYVALEGSYGLANRIYAFQKDNMMLKSDMPFAVIPSPVNFLDPKGNIGEFIEVIEEIKGQIGDIKLIVVDTLARAMAGGDENKGEDMGMLVQHADIIRAHTGAHVCFIHHSGKDAAKGARGHSSLRAAVDTEIEISRKEGDDFSVIRSVKQRDMEMSEDMFFGLKVVDLGPNNYGEMVTSCVVTPVDSPALKPVSRKMSPIQSFVYDAIVAAVMECGISKNIDKDMPPVKAITYDDMRVEMESRGYKEFFATEKKTTAEQIKSATFHARAALKKMGKINMSEGYIWLVN